MALNALPTVFLNTSARLLNPKNLADALIIFKNPVPRAFIVLVNHSVNPFNISGICSVNNLPTIPPKAEPTAPGLLPSFPVIAS